MVFFYFVEDLSNGSKAETEIVELGPLVRADWKVISSWCLLARDPRSVWKKGSQNCKWNKKVKGETITLVGF